MTLLLGGTGQLGTALRAELPDADAPTSRELNLLDPHLAATVIARKPDCIINCAAYTDVDRAEVEVELATAVNASAVGELARAASELGVPFITFSTDYVFDGQAAQPYTESSLPNPINVYGRSKLEGERNAMRYDGSLVIRTSWLISRTHDNFVSNVVAAARDGLVRVVDDQQGTPTAVDDLARAVVDAVKTRVTGLLHLAAVPPTTRLDLARAALDAAGLDPERALGVASATFSSAAARPAFGALVSERTATLGIAPLPSWQDRLALIVAGPE